jgi:hypothetical protein
VKFLLDNWMLIAVALMSAGMLAWPVITGGGGPGTVTAAGAVQLSIGKSRGGGCVRGR